MIPRIETVQPLQDYVLLVVFEDKKRVVYDVKEDIERLPGYSALRDIEGLFRNVQLDPSRTCVYWNDEIDLASDSIYEYGKAL